MQDKLSVQLRKKKEPKKRKQAVEIWNAQNASHITTATTAATGLNPMPNQAPTNLPVFNLAGKCEKYWTLPRISKWSATATPSSQSSSQSQNRGPNQNWSADSREKRSMICSIESAPEHRADSNFPPALCLPDVCGSRTVDWRNSVVRW